MRYWDHAALRRTADLIRLSDVFGGGRPPRRRGPPGEPGGHGPYAIPPGKCLYERPTPTDIVCMMFALFPPPLAVFIHAGNGRDLRRNIVLTLLGYLPGVVHAYWVLARH